ncbi:DEAD/DEAH box helicase [Paracoccus sulfuroxidans]|uniref:Superfamily II DNA or RNA helicase n=1 Tax=Paracoccus sulfuroxidans TaxID=384678 RepID=A0A562P1C9_9RHOB|nr:DEAD/DEAH box helicase [Paracoccus sulfuroxidans]TWI38244.1 superfamily II DNA or RNA helicase [Paracoccus sulfuroxidans]
MKLRDYQQSAVSNIGVAFKTNKRALFVLPTGGGKTTIFSQVAADAVNDGESVLVLAHRRELIDQANERLKRFGLETGLVISGEEMTPDAPVQVASIQTLTRRFEKVGKPDLIIVDEAHRAVADSYARVLEEYPDARVLGLTATPCRLDGKGLKGSFSTIVEGPSIEDLISRGYLMRPIAYSASIPDLTGVKTRAGDYAADQLAEALERSTICGDAVSSYQRITPGRSGIAFCVSVKHAGLTADAFNAAGIQAEVLTGDTPKDERAGILARLRSGETKIVASIETLTEGFDFEGLEVVLLMRPTKSLALYLQMVGRVLRISDGKDEAIVLDLSGNTLRHGLVEEIREWSLDGVKDDQNARATNGDTLKTRLCKMCFGVHKAAPVCPLCGHTHEKDDRIPVAKAGELRRIKAEELEAAKRALSDRKKQEERECRSLEDFVKLGKSRGYKFASGWAAKRWELRQSRVRATSYSGWPK